MSIPVPGLGPKINSGPNTDPWLWLLTNPSPRFFEICFGKKKRLKFYLEALGCDWNCMEKRYETPKRRLWPWIEKKSSNLRDYQWRYYPVVFLLFEKYEPKILTFGLWLLWWPNYRNEETLTISVLGSWSRPKFFYKLKLISLNISKTISYCISSRTQLFVRS